jgi:Lrp/AsnC family transcriptional regulator
LPIFRTQGWYVATFFKPRPILKEVAAMKTEESDRRILRELQRDATLTLKQLSERLAMSQSTIWRRIQEMEKDGVILGRATLVDPLAVGLSVCVFVNVNMTAHSTEVRSRFEAFAQSAPEIVDCYSVTGAHDYTLIVRTRTVEEFETFLMKQVLSQPGVATASSNLALRQHKRSAVLPI